MMGRQSKIQNKLFYTANNLDKRVRKNHFLKFRKILTLITQRKWRYGDRAS